MDFDSALRAVTAREAVELFETRGFSSMINAHCRETQLGHTNLMLCFTSGEARKSDSVGRIVFVNVMHEYHCKTANELLLHSPPSVPMLHLSLTAIL